MSAQHSMKSVDWGSPIRVLKLARKVLGSIDFDPASSKRWNRNVQADDYSRDGLSPGVHWGPGTVWLNPPGGLIGRASKALAFWSRLLEEIEQGNVSHAIYCAFNIEQLSRSQQCSKAMLDFLVCVPDKRLKFLQRDSTPNSPSHSNAIVYVPGSIDRSKKFIRVFSKLGRVVEPAQRNQ